jgi:hypothetical protein
MNVGTRVNFLPETLWTSSEGVVGEHKTLRSQDLYPSPGIRWAHNLKGGLQFVPGIAAPSESVGCAGRGASSSISVSSIHLRSRIRAHEEKEKDKD